MPRKIKKEAEEAREIKGLTNKQEKQIKLVVIFMAVLILGVIGTYFLINSTKNFEYAGVKFQKLKTGNTIRYVAKFPLRSITGEVVSYLPFEFREDPRKLENIEINGSIRMKKKIAEAYNKDFVASCGDVGLAAVTLSVYLKLTSNYQLEPFAATTNRSESVERDVPYVSCEDTEEYTVIILKQGDESRIEQKGDCYILEAANCNVMNITERFMMGLYAHSLGLEI